jgi:hypothetical protein
MTELVEEAVDVGVYHPCPARPYRFAYRLDGLMRVALGPKPIRARQKAGLKDRLEHDLQGLLDHPITHIGNTQRALFRFTRFRDPNSPNRSGTIRPVPQARRYLVEESLDSGVLNISDGDRINSRSTLILANLPPRLPENISAVNPVKQRVEPPVRRPLGRPVQRVLQSPSLTYRGVIGP